jgi:hypothetical protein
VEDQTLYGDSHQNAKVDVAVGKFPDDAKLDVNLVLLDDSKQSHCGVMEMTNYQRNQTSGCDSNRKPFLGLEVE